MFRGCGRSEGFWQNINSICFCEVSFFRSFVLNRLFLFNGSECNRIECLKAFYRQQSADELKTGHFYGLDGEVANARVEFELNFECNHSNNCFASKKIKSIFAAS
jgi:hypothetical protein